MNERIRHDEVTCAEKVADCGDVRGMAANHHHRVLDAMQSSQTRLEFAMNRTLAGDHTACRCAGAIGLKRGYGGRIHLRVAVQSEIVVRREIVVLHAVDHRRCTGDPFVRLEKGIFQPDHVGCRAVHAQLTEGRKLGKIESLGSRGAFAGVSARAAGLR